MPRVTRGAVEGTQIPKQQSIVAVAKAANVSIATVSRVMNKRGSVTPQLERRVLKAIEESGYHPNVAARALSSGRSRLFGVLISNLTNPFFPELLQHLEECAVAIGYEVLVASTAYDQQRMSQCIDRMLERKVDGVAVLTFGIEGELLSRFAERGVPLVSMDTVAASSSTYAIQVDYGAGIHQAVQHLAVLGHRRIAFVSGPEQQTSVAHRTRAVLQAMKAIGLPLPQELHFVGDHTFESGQQALNCFLQLPQPPSAILCSNDLTAIGVMHAAESAGLRIPDDLSLVGFDGVELGAYMVPPLTSVHMSAKDIARGAVEALWAMVEGKQEPRVRMIPTSLIVRRTTAVRSGSLADLQGGSHQRATR